MQDLQEFLAHLKAPAASTALCGSIIPSIFGGRPSSAKDEQPSTATSKARELLSDVLLFPEEMSTNKAAAFENHLSRLFSKPFTGLKDALTATYTNANLLATDALIQQGLGCVSVQVEGVDGVRRGGAFAIQGRLQEADFADKNPKIPHFQKLISSLPGLEEVKISVHYLQTLLAVDLDIEQKLPDGTRLKKTLKMASISEDPVVGSGKKISDHVLEALKSTKFSAAFIDAHLFCTFPTEHGLRFIFAIEPVEVATDGQTNLSPSVAVVAPSSMSKIFTDLNKIFESLTGKDLNLQSGKQLYLSWDTSSTVNPWALSRLGKVFRGVGRDLTGTPVSIFSSATKAKLFETSGVPSTLTLTLAAKAEALSQSPSVKVSTPSAATSPASSIFQKVAEADTFKPAQAFKSEEDKIAFAQELLKNLLSHPLLAVCKKLKNFSYEPWRKVLTSFRCLYQYFGDLGLTVGQEHVVKEAISWAESCPGFDSKSESTIIKMLADQNQSTFSAADILADLAKDLDGAFAPGESKSVLDTFRPDRSLFGHAYALTNSNFQSTKKYSPATGKPILEKGKPVFDENGELVAFSTLTQELVERIVETDKLLPQVIRFDITQNQVIVAPNIGKVLSAALKDQYEEPIKDFLLWASITESTASSLRLYIKQTYKVKKEITFLNLADNFFPRISDPSRSDVEHFQCNVFFTELQKRYAEFKAAKSQNTSILGTTKFLEEWLPRTLHIDPKKSAEHKALFDLYGSYGRSYLLGLVQRCALGHDQEIKYEQMLFVRGKSGSGKTELAKQIVSGIFGKTALTSWAGASKFVAELSEVPRDKDDIAQLFGKVLCLFDDISSDVLKKTEQGHLKAFLSSTRDSIRLPYARTAVSVNRSALCFATSNSRFLLNDTTSSRRMMVCDLDEICQETGNFICDLLDKDTMESLERSASQTEENEGYIDLKNASHIIALACGEAFAKGVLGEGISKNTASVFPLEGTLGRSDKSQSILVESSRLTTKEQEASDKQVSQFQIGHLGVQDHKGTFDAFLCTEFGLGTKTSFQLHELKEHFKNQSVHTPVSDNAIKIWANTEREVDGKKYKIVTQRKRMGGERVSLWVIWNLTDNCEASVNPFSKSKKPTVLPFESVARQPVLPPKPGAKSFKIQ